MKRLALCLMLLTTYCFSQAQTRVALIGGIHSSSVKIDDVAETDGFYDSRTGFHAGLLLDIPFSSKFSFQPSVMYTQKGQKFSSEEGGISVDGQQYTNYIDIPLNLVLKFPLGSSGNTNFIIGAGPYLGFLAGGKERTEVNDGGNVTVTEVDDLPKGDGEGEYKGFNWGYNALAGLEFGRIFITANYSRGLADFYEPVGDDAKWRHQTIGGTLGIFLNRGTPRVTDRDNDGINDAEDDCPDEAGTAATRGCPDRDNDGIADKADNCPDVAGTSKYNGCPIPDSDNDGINDELDRCPNQAGTAKYNGCPVPDSDNDGINDELDRCPNQAGTARYNGCPVPDSDNDGINDEEDKCPNAAGSRDNNGCPEVSSKLVDRVNTSSRRVTFATNRSTLSTTSSRALDDVVTVMNENPDLNVIIETHSAAGTNEETIMTLTTSRAEAIKDYLVSKGISADRITATGYGSSQPISSGTTAAEKAKNTRVVIKLTNQ